MAVDLNVLSSSGIGPSVTRALHVTNPETVESILVLCCFWQLITLVVEWYNAFSKPQTAAVISIIQPLDW
jgi:hypothetical protein